MAGDLLSGWNHQAWINIKTLHPMFAKNIYSIFRYKTPDQLLSGHYLALIGLCLGISGIIHLYQIFKPYGIRRAEWILFSGCSALLGGILFHFGLGFMGIAVLKDGSNNLIQALKPFFEPVVIVCLLLMLFCFFIVFLSIILRQSPYPRSAILFHPFTIQILLNLCVILLPKPFGAFLFILSFNLSLFIFFSYSCMFFSKKV